MLLLVEDLALERLLLILCDSGFTIDSRIGRGVVEKLTFPGGEFFELNSSSLT